MNIIDVQEKRTKLNIADVFTKPVDGPTGRRLFGKLYGYSECVEEAATEKPAK